MTKAPIVIIRPQVVNGKLSGQVPDKAVPVALPFAFCPFIDYKGRRKAVKGLDNGKE
jgi:hypothetical protein